MVTCYSCDNTNSILTHREQRTGFYQFLVCVCEAHSLDTPTRTHHTAFHKMAQDVG